MFPPLPACSMNAPMSSASVAMMTTVNPWAMATGSVRSSS